jgi:hypothetical protein
LGGEQSREESEEGGEEGREESEEGGKEVKHGEEALHQSRARRSVDARRR